MRAGCCPEGGNALASWKRRCKLTGRAKCAKLAGTLYEEARERYRRRDSRQAELVRSRGEGREGTAPGTESRVGLEPGLQPGVMSEDHLERLQKFLARAGVASRRQSEELIREGRVTVNGRVVSQLGTKIDPTRDQVRVDGRHIRLTPEHVYVVLNKPKGFITSCRHGSRKIVMDLIDIPQRIYPVGRLDKDSTGLLLLTNDGGLHLKLTHPSFDHEKEYEVTVANPIPDGATREKITRHCPA